MFHRALSQSLDQYVWKVVFGRFNSFFQKSFNIWEMFVVKCYIYIGFWASKLTKKLFRLYYMHLLSNLIVHLLCIWLHSLFPNSIKERYIFIHRGPLHTMMLQSCYACYTTIYLCYSVVFFATLTYLLCLLQWCVI